MKLPFARMFLEQLPKNKRKKEKRKMIKIRGVVKILQVRITTAKIINKINQRLIKRRKAY